MAESEAQIASNALQLLGLKPIINFDDGSKSTNLMKAMYALTRDAVLRAYPWKCATEYLSLPADATAPAFRWDHAYTLPTDPNQYVLRVLRLEKEQERGHKWTVKGRRIYTNANAPLECEVIIRITDVGQFDALLEDAITFRLAAAGAMPLTESQKKLEGLLIAYKEKIGEARTVDGQESWPEEALMDDLLNVRYAQFPRGRAYGPLGS